MVTTSMGDRPRIHFHREFCKVTARRTDRGFRNPNNERDRIPAKRTEVEKIVELSPKSRCRAELRRTKGWCLVNMAVVEFVRDNKHRR